MAAFGVRARPWLGLLLLAALGGCAARQPPPGIGRFDIDGKVNSSMSQLRIDIDGEPVIEGPLRVPRCRRSHLPGVGGCTPDPFPLTGSYKNLPVSVECDRQPFTGFPYCDVYVDGALADTLTFDTLAPDGGYVPAER